MNCFPWCPGDCLHRTELQTLYVHQADCKGIGFKHIKIYKTDVFIACKKLKGRKFDLIFADPPYKLDKIDDIPAAIFDNELLAENGIAIIEHPANTDFSSHPVFPNTGNTAA